MVAYLIKRLLLILPTLLGIMLITFAVTQFLPGGPVERIIAQLQGNDVSATGRISGGQGDGLGAANQQQMQQPTASNTSKYRGAQGLDPGVHQVARETVRASTSRRRSDSGY